MTGQSLQSFVAFTSLQLQHREVEGILLYQGFPRSIVSTKHPESSEGCFLGKIVRRNPWLTKISNFPKK